MGHIIWHNDPMQKADTKAHTNSEVDYDAKDADNRICSYMYRRKDQQNGQNKHTAAEDAFCRRGNQMV